MKEKKPPKKHVIREERNVRVALDDKTERERLTKILLHKLRDMDDLRIEAANIAAGYRDKIKELKGEIDGTRDDLDVGVPTTRLVEITTDFSKGRVTVKDVETGATYEEREVTEEDTQLGLGNGDTPDGDDDK